MNIHVNRKPVKNYYTMNIHINRKPVRMLTLWIFISTDSM